MPDPCPDCGGTDRRVTLPAHLDRDGHVVVRALVCTHCGVERIELTPVTPEAPGELKPRLPGLEDG